MGGAVPSTGLLGVSVPFQTFNPFLIFALSTDTVAESCAWVAMCALSLRLRSGEVWRHRV